MRESFREEDQRIFHKYFDLRLFVTFLAAMSPILLPLIGWGVGVERQLSVHQEQIRMLMEDQKNQDERYTAVTTALREDMREMSRKLDRLLETLNQRQR